MLEQNIKKKGFLGSLSFNLESEVWLLVRDSLSKGYLYTIASQLALPASPLFPSPSLILYPCLGTLSQPLSLWGKQVSFV